jgi:hypothetical protein
MAGTVLSDLSPVTRVCIAAGPFVAALLLRLILGRNRLTGSLIAFTTSWFAINMLLAPSAQPICQQLYSLPGRLFH